LLALRLIGIKIKITMKNLFITLIFFCSFIHLTKGQTLSGIYIYQSIGSVGDENKITQKAKIPIIYSYIYSKNKSNFEIYSNGGTIIDTIKSKHKEYDFEYETVETTIRPTKASYYKDFKKNIFERIYVINNSESYVKDSIPSISWEVTNETKTIDGFECTKATTNRILAGYPLKITAWFCEKIPVRDGPLDYTGLPGFILELESENLFIIKFLDLKYKPNNSIEITPSLSNVKPLTNEEFEKSYR
jgi:GLPGLI family protein